MSESSRQPVSNSKKTVASMKLFFDGGFTLDENMEKFKTAVRVYGDRAEAGVAEFL